MKEGKERQKEMIAVLLGNGSVSVKCVPSRVGLSLLILSVTTIKGRLTATIREL